MWSPLARFAAIGFVVAVFTAHPIEAGSGSTLAARIRSTDAKIHSEAIKELESAFKQGRTDDSIIEAFLAAGWEPDRPYSCSEFVPAGAEPKLELALQRPEAHARSQALLGLMTLKERSRSALPQILLMLDDPDQLVQSHASAAIALIDKRGETLPLLVGALSAATGLKNRLKCHEDDAAGGQGAGRSITR